MKQPVACCSELKQQPVKLLIDQQPDESRPATIRRPERLAKRGLLLVVNGAPIYAAASGLSGARKPPPVVDIAIESKCSRLLLDYSSFTAQLLFDVKRLQHL